MKLQNNTLYLESGGSWYRVTRVISSYQVFNRVYPCKFWISRVPTNSQELFNATEISIQFFKDWITCSDFKDPCTLSGDGLTMLIKAFKMNFIK